MYVSCILNEHYYPVVTQLLPKALGEEGLGTIYRAREILPSVQAATLVGFPTQGNELDVTFILKSRLQSMKR